MQLRRLAPALFAIALLSARPALAAPDLVAVLELQGSGVEPEMLALLTDQARNEAVRVLKTRFSVLTRANQEAVLAAQGIDLSKCDADACDVDILRQISARYGVTGTVVRLSTTLRLNLTLYDAKSGVAVDTVSRKLDGEPATLLDRAFDELGVAMRALLERTLARPDGLSLEADREAKQLLSEGDAALRSGRTAEALERFERLVERFPMHEAVRAAAGHLHQQANGHLARGKQDLATGLFEAAARAYSAYLQQHPDDEHADELTFYLAEMHYYSSHFREAAEAYRAVRDSSRGTKYQKDAARNVVYSLDKLVQQEVQAGRLADKDVRVVFEKGAKLPDTEELDPLRRDLVAAIDRLVELDPDHEATAKFAFTAGSLFFAFGRVDDAMKRLEQVVQRYPKKEAARFAANRILDYLLAKQEWRAAAESAVRFRRALGDEQGIFARIESGAAFKLANQSLDDGQRALDEGRTPEAFSLFEAAARQYLALVDEDPKREFADRMLFNAAVALERAQRPARAAALYERVYKEHPRSSYAAQAMFKAGHHSEEARELDKAVAAYLALVERYPDSDRAADAQINAALVLEQQRRYVRAAEEFERFATRFPNRPEAPEAFFRSSLVHKRRGALADEMQALHRFIARYQGQPPQAPRVIEAWARIGELQRERVAQAKRAKDRREIEESATAALKKAVSLHDPATGPPTATYFAGKAAFLLAEQEFDAYARLGIAANTGEEQGQALKATSRRLGELERTYKGIITTYKQADWSLASLYRIGALHDELARKLLAAPCPGDVKRAARSACDEYRAVLEEQARAVEDKAVEAYRVVVDRAKELKVDNEWTQRASEALRRLRPEAYGGGK